MLSLNTMSNIFLSCCLLFGFSLSTILYLDFRVLDPIYNVTAFSKKDVFPGGIATLIFTYTKPHQLDSEVIDRWLLCDDDIYWLTGPAANTNRASWPTGIDKEIEIFIRIPAEVVPGQFCMYGSTVEYKRILLPNITLRNPPVLVKIKVLNN